MNHPPTPIAEDDQAGLSSADHAQGPEDAPITLLEYGDYECSHCGQAEPKVRQLVDNFGLQMRFVFRHLPLLELHPNAELAAEAAEAAAATLGYPVAVKACGAGLMHKSDLDLVALNVPDGPSVHAACKRGVTRPGRSG